MPTQRQHRFLYVDNFGKVIRQIHTERYATQTKWPAGNKMHNQWRGSVNL
jgi:hypothetical protein